MCVCVNKHGNFNSEVNSTGIFPVPSVFQQCMFSVRAKEGVRYTQPLDIYHMHKTKMTYEQVRIHCSVVHAEWERPSL